MRATGQTGHVIALLFVLVVGCSPEYTVPEAEEAEVYQAMTTRLVEGYDALAARDTILVLERADPSLVTVFCEEEHKAATPMPQQLCTELASVGEDAPLSGNAREAIKGAIPGFIEVEFVESRQGLFEWSTYAQPRVTDGDGFLAFSPLVGDERQVRLAYQCVGCGVAHTRLMILTKAAGTWDIQSENAIFILGHP